MNEDRWVEGLGREVGDHLMRCEHLERQKLLMPAPQASCEPQKLAHFPSSWSWQVQELRHPWSRCTLLSFFSEQTLLQEHSDR